jgi:hypothetical protein
VNIGEYLICALIKSNLKFCFSKTRIVMAGNTLNELKANLHEAFQSDPVDMDHVKDLMERYTSNPADWGKFAIFDSTQ